MQEKNGKGSSLHLEDMAMKTAAQFFGKELLGYLGIKERTVRAVPTEIVHLEARQMYEDFNFEMENGCWYHFEFESDSIKMADLKRFREYEAATSRTYKVSVVTFVVCTSAVKKLMSEFTEGINTYRVKVIRLQDEDAEEAYRNIMDTPAGQVQKDQLLPILLTPLMSGKMGQKERILEGFRLLSGTYANVTEEEISRMQAVLYAFASKFLDENDMEEIKEAVAMTKLGQMLVEDGIERGIEQGIEQGEEKVNRLIQMLIEKSRSDEIERAVSDREYQKKLFREFGI